VVSGAERRCSSIATLPCFTPGFTILRQRGLDRSQQVTASLKWFCQEVDGSFLEGRARSSGRPRVP